MTPRIYGKAAADKREIGIDLDHLDDCATTLHVEPILAESRAEMVAKL